MIIISLFALLLLQGNGFQRVGAEIRPVWAPILSPELKASQVLESSRFVYFDPELSAYVLRYRPEGKKLSSSPNFSSPIKHMRK